MSSADLVFLRGQFIPTDLNLYVKLSTGYATKLKAKCVTSTSYNLQAEDFNKIMIKILKKIVKKNKQRWYEKLGECLWTSYTTMHIPMNVKPFSLVYGYEPILPLEIQIPSLRTALDLEMTAEDNHKLHLQELEVLDNKRLQAQQRIQLYQARISKAFNQKSMIVTLNFQPK